MEYWQTDEELFAALYVNPAQPDYLIPHTPDRGSLEIVKARLLDGHKITSQELREMGFPAPHRVIHLLRYLDLMPIATEHESETIYIDEDGLPVEDSLADDESITREQIRKTTYFIPGDQLERYEADRAEQMHEWHRQIRLNRYRSNAIKTINYLDELSQTPIAGMPFAMSYAILRPQLEEIAKMNIAPLAAGYPQPSDQLGGMPNRLMPITAANDDIYEDGE